jgi:hypothetical protein
MSTLIYGALTASREKAPPPSGRAGVAAGGNAAESPNVKSSVDAMAALVPAEVLAIHAVMLSLSVQSSDTGGRLTASVTNAGDLRWTFFVLLGASVALYVIGHLWSRGRGHLRWEWGADTVRALVPAAAFTLWTMLQRPSAFDAVLPAALGASNLRILIGLVGAVLLGLVAALLANRADYHQDPPPADVDPAEPSPARAAAAPRREPLAESGD